MIKKNKLSLYIYLFIFIVLIDRMTKIWALNNLTKRSITLFQGFDLSLTWNKGISLGLFSSDSVFNFYFLTSLIFIVVLIFAFYVFYLFKKADPIYFEVLILAGAISNLTDRFCYSAVVDFIDFYIAAWHWPTFNLADVAIILGVLGILWRLLKDAYIRKTYRS